jgi:hypothetical protein
MFLGNYRRYCVDVVEAAVRKFPVDAVSHILGQAQSLFRDIQSSMANFQRKLLSLNQFSQILTFLKLGIFLRSLQISLELMHRSCSWMHQ